MADVSRETSQLDELSALVRDWTGKINLVSTASVNDFARRHVEDSLQIADLCESATTWCDLGSGGGFPGLVVAIHRPDLSVTLIESDKRKSVFLRHAARRLELDVQVIDRRIEATDPVGADAVSARALAPLPRLLGLAVRHGTPDSRYIFPKGARYQSEIADARAEWSFDIDVRPSKTDKEAVILILENVERV